MQRFWLEQRPGVSLDYGSQWLAREGFQTMSLHEHVDSLRAKHARLEQQIDEEQHRPLPDSAILLKLKREKLRLKEAIEKLQYDSEMETDRSPATVN